MSGALTSDSKPRTPRGIEAVRRHGPWERIWRYRVRWTDPATRRRRAAEFSSIVEAEQFREDLRRARHNGTVAALSRGKITLREFYERSFWPGYVMRELADSTRLSYKSHWRCHLAPRLGDLPLHRITTPVVQRTREQLEADGVRAPTIRHVLAVLQSICRHAVLLGEIEVNPVREVRKPAATRLLAISPPSPVVIEAIRAELDPAGALLVSLIGYEGLRPAEALALEERHIMSSTLLVEQKAIDGRIVVGLKTGRRRVRHNRNPKLYAPVREDIEQHLARTRNGRHQLLLPGPDGRPWTTAEYARWRRDEFKPAAERLAADVGRPYNLRHACASLLLHAGAPLTEISEHMGHSIGVLADNYAHLITDLRDVEPVPVEEQIRAARTS